MGTPDYDLDDILNEIISKNVGTEIKSRLDEIEKAKEEPKKEDKPKAEEKKPAEPVAPQPEKIAEKPKAPVAEPKPAPAPKKPEAPAPKKAEVPAQEKKAAPAPNKAAAKPAEAPKAAKPAPAPKKEKPAAAVKKEEPAMHFEEPFLERNRAVPADEADGSVNLFDLGGYESEEPKKTKKDKNKKGKKKWRKTTAGKICISIIVILVLSIVGTGGYAVWYLNGMLDNMTVEPDPDNTTVDEWKGMEEFTENFETINETAYVSSYRDMVKKWYYNGDPAKQSNVLNIMLIGEDTRGDSIQDSGTRADSAIIASVNTNTSEIVLTSILRDAYVYYETTPGDESTGRYGKINGAMAFGGVGCYINAVERMFKVDIDNYVIVNFTSFQKIIDSLGGVTITMTNSEIREINNHPNTYGNVRIDGEAGEIKLTGQQALAYCRIRHIDSDNARADRQKTVLLQLFKQIKDASAMKLAEVATTLLPYVKTGLTKKEILSIGQYALSHGWISYKTVTYTVPTNETNTDGTALTTCKGGTYYGEWVWKVDCPLASQILQKKIYGKTSISLADNRPNFTALNNY